MQMLIRCRTWNCCYFSQWTGKVDWCASIH
jgi:hypothetical protein